MAISDETQQKIGRFAREQAELYLNDAEMTYMEKLRRKAGRTRGKISDRLARFRNDSDKSREARDDLVLYMNDYMNDLIAGGADEREAFEKACAELGAAGKTENAADFRERFQKYYTERDPAYYEAIGLFYGGFLFLGLSLGGLTGFLLGGGAPEFLADGWIDALIGAGFGITIGIGLGQIAHAMTAALGRK